MMKAREVREIFQKNGVGPNITEIFCALIEEQNELKKTVYELSTALDQMVNIIKNTVDILDKAKNEGRIYDKHMREDIEDVKTSS